MLLSHTWHTVGGVFVCFSADERTGTIRLGAEIPEKIEECCDLKNPEHICM